MAVEPLKTSDWLRAWYASIFQGRNIWHIITNITRNSFQLFTTSTPTANFLSSLICTDCTTQQLSRHTSKVSKNLQFCTVFTDRLLATSSPTLWWRNWQWQVGGTRQYKNPHCGLQIQVSQHVLYMQGLVENPHSLWTFHWSVLPFTTMGLGEVTSNLSTIPYYNVDDQAISDHVKDRHNTRLLTREFIDPIVSYCDVFFWSGWESPTCKWWWKTGWNLLQGEWLYGRSEVVIIANSILQLTVELNNKWHRKWAQTFTSLKYNCTD